MDYALSALTALLTFVSPCVLPLLPVFATYFAAGKRGKLKTLINALAFCLGISLFYIVLYGTTIILGRAFSIFIAAHKQQIFAVCGIILVCFGLKFMGYLSLPFLEKGFTTKTSTEDMNVISAFVMGLVFSLSMGSCAVAYMGFDMMRILTSPDLLKSILVAVIFIISLDLLFILCSLLIDQLKWFFGFIKRHYKVINMICGAIMIVLGFLMALGFFEIMAGWLI